MERIHASPTMAVVVVAGAGSQALSWLLGVPGASKTVLEVLVPYGRRSMSELLGGEPDQFVSPETARRMAEAAFNRALHLREAEEPVVGLACTASIATDRAKRGEHRCFIAAWDDAGVTLYDLKLAKGERDRPGEEEVVSRLVLRALAEACGIDGDLSLGLIDGEKLHVLHTDHSDPVKRLLASDSDVDFVVVHPDGQVAVGQRLKAAVFPGSFEPLHWGHERLARVASEMLGIDVVFEISVTNVDKPPLVEGEVRSRLGQFRDRWPVALTRAPTFREKAALFPGCPFIIGWDTAVRLVHPRYYGGSKAAMNAALGEIREAGCRFLVAGRAHDAGYRTLADVDVPEEFAALFEAIPESRFRADVSSTEMRERTGT